MNRIGEQFNQYRSIKIIIDARFTRKTTLYFLNPIAKSIDYQLINKKYKYNMV